MVGKSINELEVALNFNVNTENHLPLTDHTYTAVQIEMFYKVQWLEFWLKVDIFFELVLIVFVAAITTNLVFRILCIIMAFFIAIGLVMARIAISYESQWMMFGFLFLQLLLFLCNVYSLFGLFLYSDKWFTGIIFGNQV